MPPESAFGEDRDWLQWRAVGARRQQLVANDAYFSKACAAGLLGVEPHRRAEFMACCLGVDLDQAPAGLERLVNRTVRASDDLEFRGDQRGDALAEDVG